MSTSAAVKVSAMQNAKSVARKVLKMFKASAKKTALLWPRPRVGNQQSIAGRIDCMIFLAGHIHSQFENFVLKIDNITSQIY